MLAFTHLATGVFVAAATATAVKASHLEAQLLILGGLIGSLLPDIDHPRSWIGRRLLVVSLPLSALVGHRGITHSLLAILATITISVLAWPRKQSIAPNAVRLYKFQALLKRQLCFGKALQPSIEG